MYVRIMLKLFLQFIYVLARATPPYMRLLSWDLQGHRSSLFS